VDHGSKNRLMPMHAELFTGATLFDELARTVCGAGVLPRKELYEAWEVARRVRRRIRGGRIIDFACGHALLAHVMLLLDDTSPSAIAFDTKLPPSAHKLHEVLVARWPRLASPSRVVLLEASEAPQLAEGDVLVSCHACGALTDDVIARALAVRAAVAVLPCCHDEDTCDAGALAGWMDFALAVDATRAARVRAAGYDVVTQEIPKAVTPKNRLLIGIPPR
jgi:hypothetical protein